MFHLKYVMNLPQFFVTVFFYVQLIMQSLLNRFKLVLINSLPGIRGRYSVTSENREIYFAEVCVLNLPGL